LGQTPQLRILKNICLELRWKDKVLGEWVDGCNRTTLLVSSEARTTTRKWQTTRAPVTKVDEQTKNSEKKMLSLPLTGMAAH